MQEQISVKYNHPRIFLLAIFFFLLTLASLYALQLSFELEWGFKRIKTVIFFCICFPLFLYSTGYYVEKLKNNDIQLTINVEGVLYRPFAEIIIPWSEILEFWEVNYRLFPTVYLILRNPDRFANNMNPGQKILKKFLKDKVVIDLKILRLKEEKLLNSLDYYLRK